MWDTYWVDIGNSSVSGWLEQKVNEHEHRNGDVVADELFKFRSLAVLVVIYDIFTVNFMITIERQVFSMEFKTILYLIATKNYEFHLFGVIWAVELSQNDYQYPWT